MTDIFISHSVADKALAEKLVAFLKEAIGLPAKSIFCSSIDGHNIRIGADFNEYMKKAIQNPKLVILLITPRYLESQFCLMELGATWAKSLNALPIVVPPIKFDVVSKTLGLKQAWSIDNNVKLVDLRQMIEKTGIKLEKRTEHDWDKKRVTWAADLKKVLKNLAPATSVTASDYKIAQDELVALNKELADLQDAYTEASETIEELKAAKDPAAVKSIMSKKIAFDPEAKFEELMQAIADARPKVSYNFYLNLIMDRYSLADPVDWSDRDQELDARSAVKYKIMARDPPHEFLWADKKLKAVSSAIKALEDFLNSDEASDFVKERTNAGKTMETDNLEFWEENLS
jgi:hypothetical protein